MTDRDPFRYFHSLSGQDLSGVTNLGIPRQKSTDLQSESCRILAEIFVRKSDVNGKISRSLNHRLSVIEPRGRY